jgi:uncharacterized membrane protein YraQ (UPF0718 family)
MSSVAHALFTALSMAFAMGWEILWPLILGFALSGVVQAVVTKGEISRLLPDSSLRSIVIATALGAASSSCSYAAVALARSIFRKGADFAAAMAFQFASTNLVLELGIILAVLIGWQFVAAEFAGGLTMVVLLTVTLRAVMNRCRVEETRRQADRGLASRMEGHAAMDMSVGGEGSILARIMSPKGFTAISHYFVMDWASIWIDIALGSVDRRCPCRLGAEGVLASLLPLRRSGRVENRWAADRPYRRDRFVRLLGRERAACKRCCGTAGSASAASSRSCSPT